MPPKHRKRKPSKKGDNDGPPSGGADSKAHDVPAPKTQVDPTTISCRDYRRMRQALQVLPSAYSLLTAHVTCCFTAPGSTELRTRAWPTDALPVHRTFGADLQLSGTGLVEPHANVHSVHGPLTDDRTWWIRLPGPAWTSVPPVPALQPIRWQRAAVPWSALQRAHCTCRPRCSRTYSYLIHTASRTGG